MKYIIIFSILLFQSCSSTEYGDSTASNSWSYNGNARDEFIKECKKSYLRNNITDKNIEYVDIIEYADSIMFSKGYVKFGGFYYLGETKKYYDEILNEVK